MPGLAHVGEAPLIVYLAAGCVTETPQAAGWILILDQSLIRGHETHPTKVDPRVLWGIQSCPKQICLEKESSIVGCLVFIVLPSTVS